MVIISLRPQFTDHGLRTLTAVRWWNSSESLLFSLGPMGGGRGLRLKADAPLLWLENMPVSGAAVQFRCTRLPDDRDSPNRYGTSTWNDLSGLKQVQ